MAEGTTHVLLPNEAELLIQSLDVSNLESLGSKKWWSRHDIIEKLNIQAVVNASSNTDEFVKEFCISHNKVITLIYDLLVSELWTEEIFPCIKERINMEKSTLPVYMALFHEATVVGLLETMLYYKEACEAAGDAIIDLIDFVNRKLTKLLLKQEKPKKTHNENDDLMFQHESIQFTIYMKSLSILRYISDSIECLPLSALTRILNVHDIPCLLVNILDTSPWKRINEKGNPEIYNDNKWCSVEKDEQHLLSKLQGQVWLTLYQLLMHPEAQRKYEFNTSRKTQILKLRRYLNEVLLDQLPCLTDLQRFLEHLAVMEPPMTKRDLVIEQMPEIRSKLQEKYRGKWKNIAGKQAQEYFTLSDHEMKEHAQRLASTYNLDVLESLLDEPPVCANCHSEAMKRCSSCQNEWYCSRPCQVQHWSKHKQLCKMLSKP
ncbi:zinc finger MYND domain-containing protein 10-like [Hydractinia symbiolongicarpus]|uniref:zinc finger MYND domain-containing protein 10-like n=1 Tax=Hydractinia symbiolongicarpus TaxID=13093 RepID=UPI00254A60CA|nr:zinc finger MYND domain-containing protein 10-like [Hydractinia symbiolongicarpus]